MSPNIACFAHTLNLAAQKGLGVNQMHRILGKVRRIVAFFHRSTTAAAVLDTKQKQLLLPNHKLVMDVVTRWNSSYEMLERYIEQKAAVYAALTDESVKKNVKALITLSDEELKTVEMVVEILQPLKKITDALSSAQNPTVSMIRPLYHWVLIAMEPSAKDSPTVRDLKSAIEANWKPRYSDPSLQLFLDETTELDPRFKSLSYLDALTRSEIFKSLTDKILQPHPRQASGEETGQSSAGDQTASAAAGPPAKKSALSELFGDFFSHGQAVAGASKPWPQVVEEEVQQYRLAPVIELEENPLKWWKENKLSYPHLSKLAKSCLPVQAPSVPSERVFSTAGDVVTAHRRCLDPQNVNMLIFVALYTAVTST
ncbi:E3 SUMO-protein ligase ZBED1-like [Acanthochromis polyacanthus]|uniref:E3 SUMO-protein ligase ZBED1-like n=1 Tax=Acanthochromis polyacanthus TaxID=80966 RepID=UPI002234959A|nr:E3 SUMO-protein ligase ZBED1-like [Acanthochromis polyacanthus]XP_051814751.1 E3 SUMO-protein ligase ZBED1-like [Acanthochromis polyacanthus]